VQRATLRDPQATPPPPPAAGSTYDPQREAASPPPPSVTPEPAGCTEPAPTLDVPATASLDAPPVTVQDLPSSSAPAAAGTGAPAARTADAAYRVQVFAGTDRDAAETVRREVEARFGTRAVLAFQSPFYKVRVGECPTSEACRELQDRLRASGYDTVWIVSDATP
jgi:hypothetical protein